MIINPNVHPKTGHFFKDSEGVRHFADSWPGVIARVKAYRKRMGKPEGDVAAEVTAQACSREPIICHPDGRAATESAVRKSSLKSKILSWLVSVRGNQEKRFVDDALAKQRADICAKCPKQVPLPGGCASCANAVIGLRKEIVGGRPLDARLTECDVMTEDTQVTTWIDMTAVDNPDLPAHCWRRRSI